MASDDAARPSLFYDNPEYKRHPNDTKTDQLPISEVITGLPRPYHHTYVHTRYSHACAVWVVSWSMAAGLLAF